MANEKVQWSGKINILKIDEKIWPTKKCSGAEKLTSKKKKKKTSRGEAETD